jgi:hypothetical protein
VQASYPLHVYIAPDATLCRINVDRFLVFSILIQPLNSAQRFHNALITTLDFQHADFKHADSYGVADWSMRSISGALFDHSVKTTARSCEVADWLMRSISGALINHKGSRLLVLTR